MARKFPCPKCGTENPIGQSFCTGCGEKFEYKIAGEEQSLPVQPPAAPPYRQPFMPPAPPVAQGRSGAWAFLGAVVAILCIGAVILLVAIGSETDSIVPSGGFSFNQLLPGPSLPPPAVKPQPEKTETPQQPDAGSSAESSRYSEDLVIAVAKKVSPECRKQRVG